MDVIMCGPYIVQNRFIRYIKVRYERMCWCLQIFVCVAKRGQAERIKDSSVMSPTRLNQLPEKQ